MWLAVSVALLACRMTGVAAIGVFSDPSVGMVPPGFYVCLGAVGVEDVIGLSCGGRNLVHCLLPDERAVQPLRAQLCAAGAPRVRVDALAGDELPYVDMLVNALLVEDFATWRTAGGTLQELLRVMAPQGNVFLGKADGVSNAEVEACGGAGIRREGGILRFRKIRPVGMDEWTHFEHDAGRTSVSSDTLAGVPRGIRWAAGPAWTTYPAFSAPAAVFVSGGGRNFYWITTGTKKRWQGRLTCRDAFNGLPLWQKDLPAPPDAGVMLAEGDAVFLRVGAEVVRLSAVTGEETARFAVPAGMRNLLCSEGKLVCFAPGERISVHRGADGEMLWEKTFEGDEDYWHSGDRVLAGDGRLYMLSRNAPDGPLHLACLDLSSGAEVWRVDPGDALAADGADTTWLHLVACADGYLLAANGSRRLKFDAQYGQKGKAVNYAFSCRDGRLFGKFVFDATGHGGFATSLYYLDGLVWSKTREAWIGWDPLTGVEKRRSRAPATTRCYPDHVVGNRILSGKMDFVDIESGETFVFVATRSACGTGFFPANGTVYTFPTRCFCFPMIRGYLGLAPASALNDAPGEASEVVRGPAFGARAGETDGDAWPTYRGNAARGGAARTVLPVTLQPQWEAPCGEPVSAPVVASGRVYACLPESGRVIALDVRTGAPVWIVNCGGAVNTPPTWTGGLLVFGTASGWVHCVTAAEGRLVWKYRAAPADRMTVVDGQVESVWPVHGSVLVSDGRVYFASGRHTFMDGGVFLHAVDLETGAPLWTTRATTADGSSLVDIPCTDGETVYFSGSMQVDPGTGNFRAKGSGMALWAPMGITVDNTSFAVRGGADNIRGQWLYADRTATGRLNARLSPGANYVSAKGAAGNQLVFDGARVFGFYQDPSQPKSTLSGRNGEQRWSTDLPPWSTRPLKAMLLAGDRLYLAGVNAGAGDAATGWLIIVGTTDGAVARELPLSAPPRWDGMAAAEGRLFVSAGDRILCLGTE